MLIAAPASLKRTIVNRGMSGVTQILFELTVDAAPGSLEDRRGLQQSLTRIMEASSYREAAFGFEQWCQHMRRARGMMLEMPNEECMQMLEDESKLRASADEANQILDGGPPPPPYTDPWGNEWEHQWARRQTRALSKRAAAKRRAESKRAATLQSQSNGEDTTSRTRLACFNGCREQCCDP